MYRKERIKKLKKKATLMKKGMKAITDEVVSHAEKVDDLEIKNQIHLEAIYFYFEFLNQFLYDTNPEFKNTLKTLERAFTDYIAEKYPHVFEDVDLSHQVYQLSNFYFKTPDIDDNSESPESSSSVEPLF